MMNSANAFSYAISGSFTEGQMNRYSEYLNSVNSAFSGAGGWLQEQTTKIMDNFNNFFNSRAWEMSKRLTGEVEGDFVSSYDIGYLGSVHGLQGATGIMRNYIMSHPLVMQGYLDETFEGYGGEFSNMCFGIGEENLFYRKAMDGLLNLETVDDKQVLRHTHFYDSNSPGLSFRERENIARTHRAIAYHVEKGLFDITSPTGKELNLETEEEVTETIE